MEAVEVRKALDGGVWVTARAESIGEALAAVKVLHELPPSDAYLQAISHAYTPRASWSEDELRAAGIPVPEIVARPLTPEQEARLAATDPPDPIDVLNVDKPRSYEDGRE